MKFLAKKLFSIVNNLYKTTDTIAVDLGVSLPWVELIVIFVEKHIRM